MNYEERLQLTINKFDEYLKNKCNSWNFPKVLQDSMQYALFTGGKRFRPVLLLETFKTFYGDVTDYALDFACAIECMHTYSLVHDDLPCMDDDDYRRGQLTVHKKFGEDIAVLTGDALLNYSYELMLSAVTKAGDQEKALKALKAFSSATGANGLIGGQVKDLSFNAENATIEDLRYVFTHKTCDLIVSAVECGALLACASEKDVNAMKEFAYNFGFAFQIADDLLDGEAGDGCSILKLYDEDLSKKLLNEYTNKAINALNGVSADTYIFRYLAEKAEKREK